MPNTVYRNETSELERLLQRSAQDRVVAEVEARMRLENKLDSFIVETQGNFNRFDDRLKHTDEKLDSFIAETKENFNRIDDRFERLEEKFDGKIDRLENKIDGLEKKFDSFKKWAIGLMITVVATVAIGVVSILAAIFAQ